MKKETKFEIALILSIAVSFILSFYLKELLTNSCIKTNSPLLILLDTILNYAVLIVISFVIPLILLNFKSLKKLIDFIKDLFFISNKSLIIIGLILLASCFLPVNKKYEEVKINGKRPLKIQYAYYLLCDAIENKTETITIDSEKFSLDKHSYSTRGGRGSRTRYHRFYCASFEDYTMYLYENVLTDYIDTCRKYEMDIEIEYYKNSGNIKSIDGISLYDESGFDNAMYKIEREIREKENLEKQIKEKEEQKRLAAFSAFFEAEGENYEQIVKSLEAEGIENPYETVYISTKYFEIGSIAFFHNMGNKIYVVRDNDNEDMHEIPPIPDDATFTEITRILDDAGIKWTFDCFSDTFADTDELDHSNDILHTVHCSPGTPVPKDYVFWFSVKHVD